MWAQVHKWRMVASQHLPWVAQCAFTLLPTNKSLTVLSMLIMLNRHSHLTMFQLFIWPFWHLKPFTEHGSVMLTVQNMSLLPLPFMLHMRRSMSTTRKLHCPLCTSCPWVWIFAIALSPIADIFLALNPKEKSRSTGLQISMRMSWNVLRRRYAQVPSYV